MKTKVNETIGGELFPVRSCQPLKGNKQNQKPQQEIAFAKRSIKKKKLDTLA